MPQQPPSTRTWPSRASSSAWSAASSAGSPSSRSGASSSSWWLRFEALARSNVATALTKRGELAAAGRADAAAMALLPRVGSDVESAADILLGHAYWLTRMGRTDEAEKVIARTEREWRVSTRGLRLRARVAYERGDYRRAAELVERAWRMGGQWLKQDERMRDAFLESAKTGKRATIPFEQPIVK